MIPFIQKKTFSHDSFNYYLQAAIQTNLFSNYAWAVKELEKRARDLLKIDDSKAVVATSNGTTALAAMVQGIRRDSENSVRRVGTQDFTFPTNSLGPAEGPIVADLKNDCMIDFEDKYILEAADIIILTNCFGHLYDLDKASQVYKDKIIIYDNAATPYSFYNGVNALNYGTGSFVSLHHTKPIGFGEGGLAIIDKKYEKSVRAAVNFGYVDGQFNENGGNYKMSEISAAGILQWWDQFDIDELSQKYRDSYYKIRYELRHHDGDFWPHYSDDNFFPNCVPFIHSTPVRLDMLNGKEVKKYYKPLRGFPISSYIYDRISCIAATENL